MTAAHIKGFFSSLGYFCQSVGEGSCTFGQCVYQETFTLTGLQLANQYWVRSRAVSVVGVSKASDSVLFTLQGKVNVPVDLSWVSEEFITFMLITSLLKCIIHKLWVKKMQSKKIL